MKSKLQVGQVVFVMKNGTLKKETITMVGRKYFYTDKYYKNKILIDNMRRVEWTFYYYFLSVKEYNDVLLQGDLYYKVEHCAMLSLDKLKRICAIIDEEEK